MIGAVQSDWYGAAYMGDAGASNPFGQESRADRRNGALHAHLAAGHSILTFPRGPALSGRSLDAAFALIDARAAALHAARANRAA